MDLSKRYLVTGGSGFLGIELIKRLTEMGYINIVSVSRNEGRSVQLKELFPLGKTAFEIVAALLSTSFSNEKRHIRRLEKVAAYDHSRNI